MWSKITNTFSRGGRGDNDASSSLHSHANVLSGVLEQHPNLSNFQDTRDLPFPSNPSPPSSPSKSRGSLFKRFTKAAQNDDSTVARPASPFSIGQPKKVRAPIPSNITNASSSQVSISRVSVDDRRRSFDALRRSQDNLRDSARSPITARRPSLELLRARPSLNAIQTSTTAEDEETFTPPVPIIDTAKAGSTRSILREPNTPGTGQSVRFFSRQAPEAFSPDPSMESEELLAHQNSQPKGSLFGRIEEAASQEVPPPAPPAQGASSPIAMPRKSASFSRSPKPALADIFSPLEEQEKSASFTSGKDSSNGMLTTVSPPDVSLDMSQEIDIPTIPPGLETQDQHALSIPDFSQANDGRAPLSSTPFRDGNRLKLRPKQTPPPLKEEREEDTSALRDSVDENIFHARERSPHLPHPLHDRSQSFSLGQTVFFSMNNDGKSNRSSSSSTVPSLGTDSRNSRASQSTTDSPLSTASLRSRGRALSDTVFHSMLRSSPKDAPESDINDEQSADLIVDPRTEPDPFRADANTYYGPQTMIPVTPPRTQNRPRSSTVNSHMRTSSKEENVFASLQTQLALQTELCGQYEADLRARDELVQILGKRLTDIEKEEARRKGVLRAWKKKVAELEKACRYLEEEVETSRQESMERSVMDEASGEALRMLHRQIANFDHERGEWHRKEDELRDKVEELVRIAQERENEVRKLKETVWTREESERQLKSGIETVNEQMEMLGNVSIGYVDPGEVTRIVQERDQQVENEKQRYRSAELEWGIQRDELVVRLENLEAQKVTVEDELEGVSSQLKDKEEELAVLRGELEAQWKHTEGMTEKTDALENERRELEKETETLRSQVHELNEKVASVEADFGESESRRLEVEQELAELDDNYVTLLTERDELEKRVQQEHQAVQELQSTLEERNAHIEELQKERQYAVERMETLQSSIKVREGETGEYAQRIRRSEEEVEQLREQLGNMERQHAHAIEEQTRALQEASTQEGEARHEMENALKQKAEADVELRTARERITALRDEIERLRRQVHDLQQDSADKEVKFVQLNKQHAQDKEDLQGLNIALDAKQQELELIKRKQGTRGTAGSTPAQPTRVAHHRRESSIFATPGPAPRPSSSLSNASKDGNSSETPARSTALGKSTRLNTSTSVTPSAFKVGSMGPPPPKPRASIATPTPAPRVSAMARSSSARPVGSTSSATPLRRTSSATVEQSSTLSKLKSAKVPASPAPDTISEREEKENVKNSTSTPSTSSVKRRSMIPAPA